MRTGSESLRLRIFVHEALRHARKPLYAAIVELARREGLAGATVFRGPAPHKSLATRFWRRVRAGIWDQILAALHRLAGSGPALRQADP